MSVYSATKGGVSKKPMAYGTHELEVTRSRLHSSSAYYVIHAHGRDIVDGGPIHSGPLKLVMSYIVTLLMALAPHYTFI